MTAAVLLWTGLLMGQVLGCTSGKLDTTSTPPPGPSTTAGEPTPPWCTADCDGWNTWVDELEAQFLATGTCPTEPPKMVAQPDGTLVAADPYVLDTSKIWSWGLYTTDADSAWLNILLRETSGITSCDEDAYRFGYAMFHTERPDLGTIGLELDGSYGERRTVPFFDRWKSTSDNSDDRFGAHIYYGVPKEHTPPNGHTYRPIMGVGMSANGSPTGSGLTGSYMWTCIDSIETPSDFQAGRGAFHGSVFIHIAWWETGDGTWYQQEGPPTDIFVRLGDMDCTFPEDASHWSNGSSWGEYPYQCAHWSTACDGLDNDMDGEIDEGQPGFAIPWGGVPGSLDDDDNGVADCMDDWDGDGIPNTLDDDVDPDCSRYY